MRKTCLTALLIPMLNACQGQAERENVAPLVLEAFSDILLDADAEDSVHRPDPTMETGATLYAFGGQTLYRLWVSRKEWTAERLGAVPENWNVQGLAVDAADSQMLYLLVHDEAEGLYRIYRGTGRKEWTGFNSFKLPLKTEQGATVGRVPVKGLAAYGDYLLVLSEYVEEPTLASSLSRTYLETYSISLEKTPLFPERILALEGDLIEPENTTSHFQVADIGCTVAFHRRAFALNQLAEERNCLTYPMAVGSVPSARRHGGKSAQEGARATLTQVLSEARSLSALPNSHGLLLLREGALELYDSWLEERGGKSFARLDRHAPRFSSEGAETTAPTLQHLAGYDRAHPGCRFSAEFPLWAELTALSKAEAFSVGAQASSMLRRQRQEAHGARCACEMLSQTQNFLKQNEMGAEELWVAEVAGAVQQESVSLGCELPKNLAD